MASRKNSANACNGEYMKILILDDMDIRHELFKVVLAPHELTHVHTAREALAALMTDEFEMVFLDHDLESEEENGFMLTELIVENKIETTADFIIHSTNPEGAENMYKTLKANGYLAQKRLFGDLIQLGIEKIGAWQNA